MACLLHATPTPSAKFPVHSWHSVHLQRCCDVKTAVLGAAVSDPDEVATQTAPIFVSWSVYKSKGALSVKPVKPRWTTTSGGAFQLDRCVPVCQDVH